MKTLPVFQIGVGPDGGKGADDLLCVQIGKQIFRVPYQFHQPLHAGGKGGQYGLSHSAEQEIAFHAGDGGDALAAALGLMEENVLRLPGQSIQHQILRPVPMEAHRGRKQQFLHPVGIEPPAVEHRFAGNVLTAGSQKIAVFVLFNASDSGIQHGNHAVFHGAFVGGDAKLPGIHCAGGRCVQRALHAGFQHRLHILRFPPGKQPQAGYAVLHALLHFFAETGQGGFVVGHKQRTPPEEGNLQLPAERFKFRVAPHCHFRFQTAGPVVIARVDDGAVSPGDAGAHVLSLFQQHSGKLPAHQVPGREAA